MKCSCSSGCASRLNCRRCSQASESGTQVPADVLASDAHAHEVAVKLVQLSDMAMEDRELLAADGGAGVNPVSRCVAICPHSQGWPWAALPIMTPAAPVWARTCAAICGESMSPLANTGISVAATIAAIVSYSARPSKAHARVRPCTARAAMPASSAMRAMVTPFLAAGRGPCANF